MQIFVGFNVDESEDYYDSKTKLSIILLSYIDSTLATHMGIQRHKDGHIGLCRGLCEGPRKHVEGYVGVSSGM